MQQKLFCRKKIPKLSILKSPKTETYIVHTCLNKKTYFINYGANIFKEYFLHCILRALLCLHMQI